MRRSFNVEADTHGNPWNLLQALSENLRERDQGGGDEFSGTPPERNSL
jgi:hypothetical protein